MALSTQQREIFVDSIENVARSMLDLNRDIKRLNDSVMAFGILNDAQFTGLPTAKKQDLQKLFSIAKSYELFMDGTEDVYPAAGLFDGSDPATWVSNGSVTPRVELAKYVLDKR